MIKGPAAISKTPFTESSARELILDWLKRDSPHLTAPNIVVKFRDFEWIDLRGRYAMSSTHHYFAFSKRFVETRFLPAIMAHEVGHCLNTIKRENLLIRTIKIIRGKGSDSEMDRVDFWIFYFLGGFFIEEMAADRHALRILTAEGIPHRLLIDTITIRRVDKYPKRIDIADGLVRWVRMVHYHVYRLLHR